MNISSGLRKIRKEKKITQIELGKIVDLTPQYISDIENGRRNPTDKTIKKLLEPLGISYVDFLIDYCGVSRTVPSHWIETMGKNELEEYTVDLEEAETLGNKMSQNTLYLDDVFKEVVKEGNVHEVKEHQKRIILDYEYLSDNELYALRVFLETLKKMRK